ncbi:MAG: 50S ribosomal protein L21 [Planctomycetes bacterium]|nr:50S ribosomal protein L21 [Planctomycetota bacterium]
MYAIIADGGRQYQVQEGQELDIDYRQSATTGDSLVFGRVLAVSAADGVQLGQPDLDGVKVTAKVLGVQQGEKLFVQKLRRRKTFRRRTGHRQLFTRVRITAIEGPHIKRPIAVPTDVPTAVPTAVPTDDANPDPLTSETPGSSESDNPA